MADKLVRIKFYQFEWDELRDNLAVAALINSALQRYQTEVDNTPNHEALILQGNQREDDLCLYVHEHTPEYICGELGRRRTSNLPDQNLPNGARLPLQLSHNSGLGEYTFFKIWLNDLVIAEAYNHHGPKIRKFPYFLNNIIQGNRLLDGINIRELIDTNVVEKLLSDNEITLVEGEIRGSQKISTSLGGSYMNHLSAPSTKFKFSFKIDRSSSRWVLNALQPILRSINNLMLKSSSKATYRLNDLQIQSELPVETTNNASRNLLQTDVFGKLQAARLLNETSISTASRGTFNIDFDQLTDAIGNTV